MADSPSRSAPPLVALRGAALAFADKVVFRDADIAVGPGDRICLVGRNGGGKSTLMRALAGEVEIDSGERFVQPGARIAYLPQDPPLPPGETVRAHVAAGLPAESGGRPRDRAADAVLAHLRLDGGRALDTLSGGEARRAAIARALVSDPDVLLLDEPTNHLDLPTVEWLEGELARFRGGLLLVSHDRAFLRALSNRTVWIERGTVRRNGAGFAAFADWSEKVLAEEEARNRRLDRRIAAETRWLREGLTARRRRNMGRLARLRDMRREKTGRLKRQGDVRFTLEEVERGGQLVLEARGLSRRFAAPDGGETVIADGFSTILRRGDRAGVIGPNGAGKTTLLGMLIGREQPDRGRVRRGFGIETVYFDQRRESLDPAATLRATLCPGGGDTVEVGGRPKHVVSYLRDFLFDDRQASGPVGALSGGERNRLLLARLFARRHNLVVLDEPTNDLDIETLELLEEVLAEYEGTVLMASHDRDFLDRVATSIVALEGGGRIVEYAGGYSDYLSQRPEPAPPEGRAPARRNARDPAAGAARRRPPRAPSGLGYRDRRELAGLPERIAALEAEAARLREVLSDPGLYNRDAEGFGRAGAALARAEAELAAAEDRWLELETRREALEEARAG